MRNEHFNSPHVEGNLMSKENIKCIYPLSQKFYSWRYILKIRSYILKGMHKYIHSSIVHHEDKLEYYQCSSLKGWAINVSQNTVDKSWHLFLILKTTQWNKSEIETFLIQWRVAAQNCSKHHPQQNQGINSIHTGNEGEKYFHL